MRRRVPINRKILGQRWSHVVEARGEAHVVWGLTRRALNIGHHFVWNKFGFLEMVEVLCMEILSLIQEPNFNEAALLSSMRILLYHGIYAISNHKSHDIPILLEDACCFL